MNVYMLRSGAIWLSAAVELAASRLFPEEWSNSTLSDEDAEVLERYNFDLKQWERHCSALMNAGTLEGVVGLDRLFRSPESAPQEPEITPRVELAQARRRLRQAAVDSAWGEIRQALVDGVLFGSAFLEIEEHVAVPAATWGSPPNAGCHLPGRRVYLGKSDVGDGLRGGRPYLSKSELEGFLDGDPHSSKASVANVPEKTRKPKKASPKLDLARKLVSRAYPNGISDSDKTVEIINRAQRAHRQDDGPQPSDDVIKRAIGRKKR